MEIAFWHCGVAMAKPRKKRKPPMRMAGWWAKYTVHARKKMDTAYTHTGMTSWRSSPAFGSGAETEHSSRCTCAKRVNSLRKKKKYNTLEMAIPTTAFQPNCVNMCTMSQFHLPATITMGGAAKCVSVPPTETFTNSSASVAYRRLMEGLR